MFTLQEPYKPRPIRFLELWQESGWRMKVYGIAYNRDLPRRELVEAAKRVARQRLPQPAITSNRYGAGFLGIHDGRGANFVFVDWWADENELHHHVYISPAGQPTQLRYATEADSKACVWDLHVMNFERQAWLDTVLTNPAGVDLEAYLAQRLNEEV
jgi:prepilin-type processing-associated H-X9-DG protein